MATDNVTPIRADSDNDLVVLQRQLAEQRQLIFRAQGIVGSVEARDLGRVRGSIASPGTAVRRRHGVGSGN